MWLSKSFNKVVTNIVTTLLQPGHIIITTWLQLLQRDTIHTMSDKPVLLHALVMSTVPHRISRTVACLPKYPSYSLEPS